MSQPPNFRRGRTLFLTGVLHAFTHLYGVALMPLYLSIQTDFRLESIGMSTLLVTVFGASYILPSYLLGILADRWSRKKLLAIGLTINALGFLMLGFSRTYELAIASVVLAGLGGSFYHPAATALVASLYPESRGKALGLLGIGASLGFFFGPFYSGWRALESGSWRTPVLELGALGLVGAAVFLWLAQEEPQAVEEVLRAPDASRGRMFPRPWLWLFFLGTAVAFSFRDFSGSAMATATSLFFQKAHDFTPKGAGLALSGIFIMSAISNPLFGHMSDRGRLKWLFMVLTAAALLIALFPHVSVRFSLVVLLAYGFFFMSSYPIVEAALMEAVPVSVRGRIFGIFITVGGLVGNFAHWVVGTWVARMGGGASRVEEYVPMFTGLAVLVVISLLGLPLLKLLSKQEHTLNPPAKFSISEDRKK